MVPFLTFTVWENVQTASVSTENLVLAICVVGCHTNLHNLGLYWRSIILTLDSLEFNLY
jgi:hypothetical protein